MAVRQTFLSLGVSQFVTPLRKANALLPITFREKKFKLPGTTCQALLPFFHLVHGPSHTNLSTFFQHAKLIHASGPLHLQCSFFLKQSFLRSSHALFFNSIWATTQISPAN